jgi:hypothetical protein
METQARFLERFFTHRRGGARRYAPDISPDHVGTVKHRDRCPVPHAIIREKLTESLPPKSRSAVSRNRYLGRALGS